MIQRIQSVFIALTVACVLAFLAFPIWTKADAATQQSISLDAFNIVYGKIDLSNQTISQITHVFYLAVMAVFAAAIGIFAIFQYKNRMRQIMMVALNSLVIGGLLGTAVYLVYSKTSKVFLPEIKGDFGIGLYLLFAALVFNWLANTFIRKDERMVKSADRMR